MNLIKKIMLGIGALILINPGVYNSCKRLDKLYLDENDFKKAKWGLYNNEEGQLNYEYFKEKGFYKGLTNKDAYIFYSDLINNDKRSGEIWLPDLDKNDSIGKFKPDKWISGEELFKIIDK